MDVEYAIRDDAGNFWGLPAKQFDSPAAAYKAFDYLKERRDALRDEAVAARAELDALKTVDPGTTVGGEEGIAARSRDLQEAIERWEREEPRRWQIVKRQISSWSVVR